MFVRVVRTSFLRNFNYTFKKFYKIVIKNILLPTDANENKLGCLSLERFFPAKSNIFEQGISLPMWSTATCG